MKLRLTATLAIVVLLAACSKPSETVIPSDMATWDKELAPAVKKLNEEDQKLFRSFVARAKLGEVFGQKEGIPFGTTVGQALEQQRKWEEERQKVEAAEKALKAKMESERLELVKSINNAVTVTLLQKRELPKNYDSGRYSEYQMFVIGVENKSSKDLAGVSGEIEFVDIFDKVVGSVAFRISEKVKPGGNTRWEGGRDYNQFLDTHRAVWNLEEGKYTTRFTPNTVVFADGSKIEMPKLD